MSIFLRVLAKWRIIEIRWMTNDSNTLFTPVQAFKDLLVNTYFWNTEDKHLYFPVTCGDIAGSYNGYTRSDYYRYVAQCEVRVSFHHGNWLKIRYCFRREVTYWQFTSTYAQKTTTSLTSAAYISPKVPATVPAWTVFTKFSARVYNQVMTITTSHIEVSSSIFMAESIRRQMSVFWCKCSCTRRASTASPQ